MTRPRSRRRLYGREADLAGVEQGGADPNDRVAKVPSPPKKHRAPPKAAVARARARAAHKTRVEGMRADARARAKGIARERAAQARAGAAARGRVPPQPPTEGGYSGPSENPVTPRPGPGVPKGRPTPPRGRGPGAAKGTGIAAAMRSGANDDKYSGTVSSR